MELLTVLKICRKSFSWGVAQIAQSLSVPPDGKCPIPGPGGPKV